MTLRSYQNGLVMQTCIVLIKGRNMAEAQQFKTYKYKTLTPMDIIWANVF